VLLFRCYRIRAYGVSDVRPVSIDRIGILLAFELSLAVTVPVLPPIVVHMHIVLRFAKNVEAIVTCFALKLWAEVVMFMHVVVG
jgi:hypothetical protein